MLAWSDDERCRDDNGSGAGRVTGFRQPGLVSLFPVHRGRHFHTDPWLRIHDDDASGLPLPGHPGHGRTASLRRQPTRIVEGRIDGGYTDVFELICGECGDHPYVDYRDAPPRLQQIRGPYPMEAGLEAYAEHLGQAR